MEVDEGMKGYRESEMGDLEVTKERRVTHFMSGRGDLDGKTQFICSDTNDSEES